MKQVSMPRLFFAFSLATLLFLNSTQAAERHWINAAGGFWTTGTNWSLTQGGASCGCTPAAGDDVFFDNGGTYTVTVVPALAIRTLNVSATTNATLSGGNVALTINGPTLSSNLNVASGSTLQLQGTAASFQLLINTTTNQRGTVDGTIRTNANGIFNTTSQATTIVTVNGKLWNNAGAAAAIAGSAATMVFANGSTYDHTITGGTIPTATWQSGSTVNIIPAALGTLAGTGQTFSNFTVAPTASVAITLTASTNPVINGNLTVNNGSLVFNNNNVTVRGNVVNAATGTINTTTANSTLTMNGTSAQTISGTGAWTTGTAGRLLNLTINNASGVTLTPALTIQTVLRLTDGPLTATALTIGIPATAVSVFRTAGSLVNAPTFGYTTGAYLLTYNGGGAVSTGNELAASSSNGTLAVTTAGTAVSLSANTTLSVLNVAASTSLDINGQTVTLSGNAAPLVNAGTLTANGTGSTLAFGGTVAQTFTVGGTLTGGEFYNLTFGNTNATGTTLATDLTVTNALSVTGVVTFNARTVTAKGTLTNTGTINTTAVNSTLRMNGASAQTIAAGGTWTTGTAGRLLNLTVDNASGVTLNATVAVQTNLRLVAGTLTSSTLTLGAASAVAVTRTAGSLANVPTFNYTTYTLTYDGGTAINTGNEIPAAATAGTLSVLNTNTAVTLSANASITGLITGANTSFDLNAKTLTLVGPAAPINNVGTLTANAIGSTIVLGGTIAQTFTIGGTLTGGEFYNLTVSNTGGCTLTTDITIANALNVTGTLTFNGRTVSVKNTITNAGTINTATGGSTLRMNGTSPQTIATGGIWTTGTAGRLLNLTIDNASGVTVNATFAVQNNLRLVAGVLTSSTLTIGIAGNVCNTIRTAGSLANVPTFAYTTGAYAITYDGGTTINTGNELPAIATNGAINVNNAGTDVTLQANASILQLNIVSGATFDVNANTLTLSGIANPVNNAGTFTANAVGTTIILGGTVAQNFTIGGTLTGGSVYKLTKSNTSTVTLGSSFTVDNDLTLATGTFADNGNTLTVLGSISSNGTHTSPSAIAGKIVISGSGTHTISGATHTFANLEIAGSGNTTNWSGTGATAVTTARLVAVGAGTTLNIGTFTTSFTCSAASNISGTVNIVNSPALKTFGDLTINSGGTFDNSAQNAPITVAGSLENDGTFTAGTNTYTFNTAAKSIGGNNPVNVVGLTISNTVSVTSGSTVNASGTVIVSSTFTNNGTLNVTNSAAILGGGSIVNAGTFNVSAVSITPALTASANPNLVYYNNTGLAQTIRTSTYHNLTIDNGNFTASMAGTTTVNGALTLNGTNTTAGTVTMNGQTVSLLGTIAGSGRFANTTGGSLTLGGTGGGAMGTLILASNPQTFGTVTFSRSGATPTASITGNLTVPTSFVSNSAGGVLTINGNLTLTAAFIMTNGMVNMGNNTVTYNGATTSMLGSITNVNNSFFGFSGSAGGFQWNMPASTAANTFRWPVGPAGAVTGFRPVSLQTTAALPASIVGVKIGFIDHDGSATVSATNVPINAAQNNRAGYVANLLVTGASFPTSHLTLTQLNANPGDYNISFNSATSAIYRYISPEWVKVGGVAGAAVNGNIPLTQNNLSFAPSTPYSFVVGEKGGTDLPDVTVYQWTGLAGTTAWANPLNWDPNSNYPQTSADDVLLDNPSATVQPTLSTAVAVRNITASVNPLTLASGAALTIHGTSSSTGAGTITPLLGSTVTYGGTGNQLVLPLTYYTLATSGTGTKTLSGDITVNTLLNIGAGSTLAASTFNTTLAGTGAIFTPTGTFDAGTGTVIFNQTGAQTIPAANYYNLTTNGARLTTSITLANAGTIGVANVFNPAATFSTGAYVVTGSTVSFNGAGNQNIPDIKTTYNNLTTAGGGIKTLSVANVTAAAVTIGSGTTLAAGANTLTLTGTPTPLTSNGTFDAGTGLVVFTSASAQTIPGLNYYNLQTLLAGVKTASGNSTINNNLTISAGTLADNGNTLTVLGNISSNGTHTSPSAVAGKLVVSGSGTHTISGATNTFANLEIAGSGNVTNWTGTGTTTTTASRLITVNSGTTLNIGTFTTAFTGNAALTTSGSVNIVNSALTKTFNDISITAAGDFTNTTQNAPLTISGSLDNDGTFAAGTNVITFNGAGKTIGGDNAVNVAGLTVSNTVSTVSGSTLNASGTVTISSTFTNAGTLNVTNAAAILGAGTIANTGTFNVNAVSITPTLTAATNPNLVNYNNTSLAQTIKTSTYHNLTLDNGNFTPLLGGATTVNNTLTLNGTNTTAGALTMNGQSLSLLGTLTGAGRLANTTGGTLTLGGTGGGNLGNIVLANGAQTIGTVSFTRTGATPAATITGNLTVPISFVSNSPGGALTVSGNLTLTAAFTMTNGLVNMGNNLVTYNGATTSMLASIANANNSYFGFLGSTGGFQWNMPASTAANSFRWPVGPLGDVTGFRPLSLQTTAANPASIVGVKVGFINHDGTATVSGTNVPINTNQNNRASYIATLLITGASFPTSHLTLTALNANPGDYNISLPSGTAAIYRYISPEWVKVGGTVGAVANGNLPITQNSLPFAPATPYAFIVGEKGGADLSDVTAYQWTGLGGTTAWTNPLNWDPNSNYPQTSADDVLLDNPSAPLQPTLSSAVAVRNITATVNPLTLASGAALTIHGTSSSSGSGTITPQTGSSVIYGGTGSQTMLPLNYYTLSTSGGGTKTLGGNVTVNTALNIGASTTFDAATYTTTVTPVGAVISNLGTFNAGTGTFIFSQTGAQTIPALNFYNLTTTGARTTTSITLAAGTIGIAGTFNPAATFTTGAYVVTGNTVSFNGAGNQNIPAIKSTYNILTTAGSGIKTINDPSLLVTTASAIIGSGTTLSGGNNTLTLTGAGTPLTNNGTFDGGTGTVNFSQAGAQAVPALTYYNLQSLLAGGKTITGGNATVNGNLTIGAGTLALGANTVSVKGNVVNNGSYTSGAGRILLQGGATAHSVSGTSLVWGNLELNDNQHADLASSLTLGGTLSLTSGNLRIGSNTLTLNGAVNSTGGLLSGSSASNLSILGTIAGNIGSIGFVSGAAGILNTLTVNQGGASPSFTLSTPLSVTTLALTNGIIENGSSNLLTVTGTAVASVTNTGGSASYVKGALARNLPTLVSGSTYAFPVGKSSSDLFRLINPTTSAPATIRVEAFDGIPSGGTLQFGLFDFGTGYWDASVTSGALTSAGKVELNRSTPPVSSLNAVGRSATTGGLYSSVGGTATTSSSLESVTAVNTALGSFIIADKYCSATSYPSSVVISSNTSLSGLLDITGDFTVNAGVTVTVPAGCALVVNANNITINGTINANAAGLAGGAGGNNGVAYVDCGQDNDEAHTGGRGFGGGAATGAGGGGGGGNGGNSNGHSRQCGGLFCSGNDNGDYGGGGGGGGGAGGSYGGAGGAGGTGANGDWQNNGNNNLQGLGGSAGATAGAQGTSSGLDISLGFGGGGGGGGGASMGNGTDGGTGGAGGGMVSLNATNALNVAGTITANGGTGGTGGDGGKGSDNQWDCSKGDCGSCGVCSNETYAKDAGAGAGGGGGSGGGIMLKAFGNASVTGTLSANGGNGGAAGNPRDLVHGTCHGSVKGGAGGGGGRIKIVTNPCAVNTITPAASTVAAGNGGAGDVAGSNGVAGTYPAPIIHPDYVAPVAGTMVSGNQTVCVGGAPTDIDANASTGGAGTFTYQWYATISGCGAPATGTSATPAPGWLAVSASSTGEDLPSAGVTQGMADLGGPTTGSTYCFQRRTTSGSCNLWTTTVSVTVNSCGFVWTGLGPDNNWTTVTNWNIGVPVNVCGSTVSIPAGTPRNPVLTGNVSVGDISVGDSKNIDLGTNTLTTCGNWTGGSTTASTVTGAGSVILTGNAAQAISGKTQFTTLHVNKTTGTTATLQAGSQIDVYTAVELRNGTLATGSGTLTFKSTSATDIAVLDNFSSGFAGSLSGTINAERYYAAPSANSYSQHYMGSPVSNATLAQFGAGTSSGFVTPKPTCDETALASTSVYGSVFSYDQSNGASCAQAGWKVEPNTAAATPAKGFSVAKTNAGVLSVTGTANLNASYTQTGANGNWGNSSLQGRPMTSGWLLVANPYLATLDLTGLPAQSGFNSQIKVWHTTGGFAGTYQDATVIAPFQAFFVQKTLSGGNTYTINAINRTRSTQTFQAQQNDHQLTITAANNTTNLLDVTTVAFNTDASTQFDADYDAQKIAGSLGRHTLYTLGSNGLWMSKNVLNNMAQTSTVTVGFEPELAGSYTFNFDGLNSFDPTSYIMLEDRKLNTFYNVRTGDYNFTADVTDAWERFVLHFTPAAEITTIAQSCDTAGSISLNQPGTANWNYSLNDANNTAISSGILNQSSPATITAPAGTYTLTLTDSNNYTVVKTITVNGSLPVSAAFTPSANTVEEDIDLTFSATANAVVYDWNFGDGTTSNQGATVSHQYAQPGTYNVTLTVTNADGCSNTTTQTITVTQQVISGLPAIGNTQQAIKIWSNQNNVYIDFRQQQEVDATIEIYNALGQQLVNERFGKNTVYAKSISSTEAAYVIVRVKNAGEFTVGRCFIANVK